MKNFKEIFKEADNKIAGIAAAPGIVISKVYLFSKEKIDISSAPITDVEAAIINFNEALDKSKKELGKVFSLASKRMDANRAAIFEAHLMILDDPVLINNIKERIAKEKIQPEFIVADEISKYQNVMNESQESYMKERAQDIEDIKQRIIRNLQKKRWQSKIDENVVVVSETLTPADTILFSRRNAAGFVTDHGGITSHAAIISRSLNIPAIVGTHNASQKIKDGDTIIVDGFHGYIIVNPTEEQKKFFSEKVEHLHSIQEDLQEFKEQDAVTKDGREITLEANVDVTGEIDIVVTSGAKGIGLYRSEQILDELGEFPNEDEQKEIYLKLSSRIYPECCTIRAFDIGGDKFRYLDYKEPNPFLGLRGIRLLLENEPILKTQMRAVLRASENKNLRFMLPMITNIEEVRKSKKLFDEVKEELKKEKIKFHNEIQLGIMIEVPSAAVMADELAHEVDFFSIGTNDLIQYLMAVDRGNDLVSELYQEFNPVVLKTIKFILDSVKEVKIPVSLCGEMAADTLAIPLLVGLGLTDLSMSPNTILYAKKIIRNFDYKSSVELANKCLRAHTQEEVHDHLDQFFKDQNIIRTRNLI